MKNYWWVTRPKRKLNQVPEIFAAFMAANVEEEWRAEREKHLTFESILENEGLKRSGNRRDQKGGGGRTYVAWFYSLGLFFYHNNRIHPTLAGEDLLKGKPPIQVLTNQVLNYQFPSPFSSSSNVNLNPNFKIRPFRFLLKLLRDNRIAFLTEEEVAKVVIGEALNETDRCYESVVNSLLAFRNFGDSSLRSDFCSYYASRTGVNTFEKTVENMRHVANTIFNWIEYTQLAHRIDGVLKLQTERYAEIEQIINVKGSLISEFEYEEFFQRKYGVGAYRKKDIRNLDKQSHNITANLATRRMVKSKIFAISASRPIFNIDKYLIEQIQDITGADKGIIEDELSNFQNGMLDIFEASYYDMAFMGREKCKEFEQATSEIFNNVFHLYSEVVANKGKHPDILIDYKELTGIIDTKAYAAYSISNDHKNRMVVNYIPTYRKKFPNLDFFMYVSGGFGRHIDRQITEISDKTGINGCGITAANLIILARNFKENKIKLDHLPKLFRIDREIRLTDILKKDIS
ncbi:restriction endonuclease FokI C-terminal domain-containing protein [Fictibacillus enclensis]|uniref:restriction endonuclease FokI C-terminal domain-containing protein n=1 Tax=Fictibacillus enclensis TaxID=1017270 RepID=UPI0025A07424|nr:restriction endonuclease FokI C-terminal domain-containing protein [Fictibacillus enclensis]MDM5337374.1 restriction endonuclease FokI C-terminal domain-containing protein [Fictibacillus enclensis]